MSLVKSTGVVALSTLCSRILGLVRDVLMAAYFGAARTADVFYVAFMIPNYFVVLLLRELLLFPLFQFIQRL
jgi:peptidoglycan biosynthesis protein MviN/MurJ (putative lipid II flippase)